ncbi:hypothetical protein GI374_09880 [Paracoccus sp. S-4012]|uniref:hypothetical protein n=1 Tax=Paracoccus sp. S-4012 TaxID=2665648 RepID=UPI0012B085B6|nr:hypothetical protein [Paracoccus sp. S-4012]MRX50749.1 hypothetical protein [Paracoccus sp. S-4012]
MAEPTTTIRRPAARTVALAGAAVAVLTLAACAPETIAPGVAGGTMRGLPASTNLHAATGLPPGAVYSVAQTARGWRVLYHASAATPSAVGQRLCASAGRPLAGVSEGRTQGAGDLPGARLIEITCA